MTVEQSGFWKARSWTLITPNARSETVTNPNIRGNFIEVKPFICGRFSGFNTGPRVTIKQYDEFHTGGQRRTESR